MLPGFYCPISHSIQLKNKLSLISLEGSLEGDKVSFISLKGDKVSFISLSLNKSRICGAPFLGSFPRWTHASRFLGQNQGFMVPSFLSSFPRWIHASRFSGQNQAFVAPSFFFSFPSNSAI